MRSRSSSCSGICPRVRGPTPAGRWCSESAPRRRLRPQRVLPAARAALHPGLGAGVPRPRRRRPRCPGRARPGRGARPRPPGGSRCNTQCGTSCRGNRDRQSQVSHHDRVDAPGPQSTEQPQEITSRQPAASGSGQSASPRARRAGWPGGPGASAPGASPATGRATSPGRGRATRPAARRPRERPPRPDTNAMVSSARHPYSSTPGRQREQRPQQVHGEVVRDGHAAVQHPPRRQVRRRRPGRHREPATRRRGRSGRLHACGPRRLALRGVDERVSDSFEPLRPAPCAVTDMHDADDLVVVNHAKENDVWLHGQRADGVLLSGPLTGDQGSMREGLQSLDRIEDPPHKLGALRGASLATRPKMCSRSAATRLESMIR